MSLLKVFLYNSYQTFQKYNTNKSSRNNSRAFIIISNYLEITFMFHFLLNFLHVRFWCINIWVSSGIEVFIFLFWKMAIDSLILFPSWDKTTNNNIFLELFEFINLPRYRWFNEYSYCFLERCSRKPWARSLSFSFLNVMISTISPGKNSVSHLSRTLIRENICLTTSSICFEFTVCPCEA